MDTARLATAMLAARANAVTLAPPSATGAALSWDEAYALEDELLARRTAAGERHAGYKIGFTNTAVWSDLGLASPLYAPIYRETIVGPHEARIDDLVAPRIEPELVFGLADGKIAWYGLGFELVQCHFPDWRFRPTDALADFGLHGRLVVSERRAYSADVATALGAFDVELLCDEALVERGNAANVLESPILALLWLQKQLHDRGRAMPEDAIVTTGTLTAAPYVHAGERWSVRASGIDLADLTIGL